jgi:hypothetical protein
MWTGGFLQHSGVTRVSEHAYSGMSLRTQSRGGIEITFDDENGYIIVEVIAAKICRCVIDIGHQVLGGERGTVSQGCGKALHAEFFANLVLRLSDAIGVENQHIAGQEVDGGQFTHFFWR